MKKSKGMQLGALLMAMMLVIMAFVPAVSPVSATPMPTSGTDRKL